MTPLVLFLMATMILRKAICADHLCSSSCGNIHNITSPFRLTTDPLSCGDQRYNLSCENNTTVLLRLYGYDLQSQNVLRYNVLAINYNNYTIRLGYPDVRVNDCSSIPVDGLSSSDEEALTDNVPFFRDGESTWYKNFPVYETEIRIWSKEPVQISKNVIFLSCESPVLNSSYIEASAPCTFNNRLSETTLLRSQTDQYYSYYYTYVGEFTLKDLHESCVVVQIALISTKYNDRINNSYDVHGALIYGFELSWVQSFDKTYTHLCYVDDSNRVRCVSTCLLPEYKIEGQKCDTVNIILENLKNFFIYDEGYKYFVASIIIAQRIVIGILVLVALLIYIWREQHLSVYDGIEAFLRSQNNLMPIRYSYRDIKKMTKHFKDKLGEGGFGSVYKGKLRSGRFVAIKMLSNSKASGQDFINEVATIGRIHHVNVVRLIGFSVEGSKRALVYDFMPNGSLDKYIFSKEEIQSALSSKEMFDISIGIARGIEYLHQGCDMKILHFDIKPHNILLDENFIPKVSDFGLARLCPLDNSMVSLTAARGTLGYMAPELYYKNIGGVSHKADVYSYGMLLMEMANQRRNLNAEAERTSQVYFPLWIFNQLSQDHDMEIENATEEESKAIKKMMIVALWCIQLKPCDRPAMNKVIKMLEGEVESLEMPPKLYLYPQDQRNNTGSDEAENAVEMSSTLEISLITNSY